MRRVLAAAVGAVVLTGASPAWAHQEISPGSVPTGRPAFLFLSAANERQVDLTRVSIDPPSGAQFGHASNDPVGWTSNLTHTNVTWTGGAIRPGRFEQFGFDVEPFPQPGTVNFRVTFGYADGTSQQAEVPLTVGQGGDAPGAGGASPGLTVAPSPEPTTEAEAAPTPAAEGEDGGDEGLATVAIVLSVVALVASAAAALASRRRTAPRPAPAGGGQDW